MPHRWVVSGLVALVVAVILRAAPAAAQPSPIQYAYDELGRLVAVVDQDGNAAIYVYDAVGNVLAIQRADAAALPAVAITAVVPEKGKPGTVVSVLGKGFGGAGQNGLAFNGAAAAVTQAFPNRLLTTVPAAAATGPITLTAPLGSASSPRPFRVVGALAVTPLTVTLGPGATQAFAARDGGVETTDVRWSVDGLVGGDASVGTISPQGVYVAPAPTTSTRTVTVTATSRDDASVQASAVVTLEPPAPRFLAALPLGVQAVDAGPRAVASAPVGVAPPAGPAVADAAPLSVSLAPVVASLSPGLATRGGAVFTLTVAGSGLDGVTSLEFLRNGAVDAAVTATGLIAGADGTRLTAQVSIAASAGPGPRVVRGRGPSGASTSAGTGGNVFTVQ